MAIMRIKVFLIGFISLAIIGCTIPSQFYLRNDLSRPITLRLYNPDVGTTLDSLPFTGKVIQVKYNLSEEFTESIVPLKVETAYIDYELPSMSTIYLGSGANSKKFNFSQAYLLTDNEEEEFPLFVAGDDKAMVKKGLTNGYYVYYNLRDFFAE